MQRPPLLPQRYLLRLPRPTKSVLGRYPLHRLLLLLLLLPRPTKSVPGRHSKACLNRLPLCRLR